MSVQGNKSPLSLVLAAVAVRLLHMYQVNVARVCICVLIDRTKVQVILVERLRSEFTCLCLSLFCSFSFSSLFSWHNSASSRLTVSASASTQQQLIYSLSLPFLHLLRFTEPLYLSPVDSANQAISSVVSSVTLTLSHSLILLSLNFHLVYTSTSQEEKGENLHHFASFAICK